MNARSTSDQPDMTSLGVLIRGIVAKSTLKDVVQVVSLEFAPDAEAPGFIRVLLEVKKSGQAKQADFLQLLETIEDRVLEQDRWYASVRFSEAA